MDRRLDVSSDRCADARRRARRLGLNGQPTYIVESLAKGGEGVAAAMESVANRPDPVLCCKNTIRIGYAMKWIGRDCGRRAGSWGKRRRQLGIQAACVGQCLG